MVLHRVVHQNLAQITAGNNCSAPNSYTE